jgi:hypothetical protein
VKSWGSRAWWKSAIDTLVDYKNNPILPTERSCIPLHWRHLGHGWRLSSHQELSDPHDIYQLGLYYRCADEKNLRIMKEQLHYLGNDFRRC